MFLKHLSDRTPFMHSVTIPSKSKLSKQMQEECICYYIKPEPHKLGIVNLKTTLGNIMRSYNAEKTICDILRLRNKFDRETAEFLGRVKSIYFEYALSRGNDYRDRKTPASP